MSDKGYTDTKCLVFITGASRGFGKTIALELAKILKVKDSLLILTARDMKSLGDTKREVSNISPNLKCAVFGIDMEKLQKKDTVIDCFNAALKEVDSKVTDFETALVFHNGATLGAIGKKASELDDLSVIQSYFQINLFSMMLLNSAVLTFMQAIPRIFVINITSLAAIQALPMLGFYNVGKAAREMFMKTLAKEEDEEKYIFLNYSPGPMATDMVKQDIFGEKSSAGPKLKEVFKNIEKQGFVETVDSVKKMLRIISENKFKPADHVDYFDEI